MQNAALFQRLPSSSPFKILLEKRTYQKATYDATWKAKGGAELMISGAWGFS